MKNTSSPASASDPGKQAHEMAKNIFKASCAGSTKTVPTYGWVFSARSSGSHPSISQPYPSSRGTKRRCGLKEIVGPKWSSGQNLNTDISSTQEGLKVSLWANGWVDRWARRVDGWVNGWVDR